MADVLPPNATDSPRFLPHSSLPQKTSPRTAIVVDTSPFSDSQIPPSSYYHDSYLSASETSSEPSSPRIELSSVTSTPPSSVSLDNRDDAEYERYFQAYDDATKSFVPASPHPTEEDLSIVSTPGASRPSSPRYRPADDTSVHDEPSRQVDYLSHEWREEDIWYSWRHIVANRKTFGERSRLENASWRTWTKAKYRLDTISAERLNWMKDCDVTWLYGPLHQGRTSSMQVSDSYGRTPERHSQPSSRLPKTDSFLKKPILKKRSVSEVMLQKSLSSSSLVKQAAAAVQAQRSSQKRVTSRRPALPRSASEGPSQMPIGYAGPTSMVSSSSVSGLQSPDNGRKHIRFDDTVEQCIAVEFKDVQEEIHKDAESSSEDDMVVMKAGRSSINAIIRRDSLGQESKGIAMLPSTTLKYHSDEPESSESEEPLSPGWRSGRLQTSSSSETLRPTKPSANFLLDEADDADLTWDPSGAFDTPRPGSAASGINDADEHDAPEGLRRTASGMFMPFDDDDRPVGSGGMLGRVIDTVNTARDIFSVIVNVGWRS